MPEPTGDRQPDVHSIARLATALALPEIELSTHYGDPSLKVAGKAMVTVKSTGLMVLHCPLDMKEVLMQMAPEIYYQTDHFKGWPGLLVRLDVISDEELSLRLEDAWRFRAPKKLAAKRPSATGG